jgi:hypothetical protein
MIVSRFLKFLVFQCLLVSGIEAHGKLTKKAQYVTLPPLREQSSMQDTWTKERLGNVPNILRKYNVDAWLMSQREHTEDTIFWSLKSFTQFSARRRTIDLFIANPTPGTPSAYSWIDNTPDVWVKLLEVLESQDPETVVINVDSDIAFSAGLHVGELQEMEKRLGKKWKDRFVKEPMVGVEFVAWMAGGGEEKLRWYKALMETAWAMIDEAFSEKVITPGKTTTAVCKVRNTSRTQLKENEDVEWWLRDKVQAMNYSTWFQPDVSIITVDSLIGKTPSIIFPTSIQKPNIINYGDMLHVDFGVTALGMNTDTQHLAYVLYPEETEKDIPQGLKDGLRKGNRLQDILIENMEVGKAGNEILEAALKQMRSEGLEGRIYSHPIGDWGHSAGTLVGINSPSRVPTNQTLTMKRHDKFAKRCPNSGRLDSS